jgi:hypothetical protein
LLLYNLFIGYLTVFQWFQKLVCNNQKEPLKTEQKKGVGFIKKLTAFFVKLLGYKKV